MPRLVLDANVLAAAALSSTAAPAAILRAADAGRVELVASPRLLDELANVLARPKFRRYLSREEATAFVESFGKRVEIQPDQDVTEPVTRDPDDDYLVVLAQAAGAQAIVTGDKDLLSEDLQPPAVTPRELLESLPREK